MTNPTGRKIVGLYYKLSPEVADFIRDKEQIKAFVRICLRPFVTYFHMGRVSTHSIRLLQQLTLKKTALRNV
jgi:hypothetical protein